ncbi:hypothetical protein CMI38_02580 [Candidatus Pacearchaeota archaeon]|jgi:hypothetical protein|nr:hypothetical protein [Candidatus Pacearchaeota archaeon]|tara:strand:- start:18939 stop:20207 length:1269 start_codon:yes stop_codon:yes gene_type:complete
MKNKAFLVSFIALFAVALAMTTVAAVDFVDVTDVEVDSISIALDNVGNNIAGSVSQTVPVVVKFTALSDASDVKIRTYIEGFKSEISDETSRFRIVDGNTYVKRFTLELPSSLDLDELTEEELMLLVRFSARGLDSQEVEVPVSVEKNQYSLNLLSIDRNEVVEAGSRLAVDVVIENNGAERLDNVYVRATIPGLGISQKVYVGDLENNRDAFDDDINDARERRIYLTLPRDAPAGNYDLEIEAYNHDTSVTTNTRVVVRGVDTRILPPVTAKTIAPGQETVFDIVLVNPSERLVVYTITPGDSKGLFVEATEPIVTVSGDSSRATGIKVRASNSLEEGTYLISVNVHSETGLSEQISFTVNVEKAGSKTTNVVSGTDGKPNTVVVLTVILVIIFVVLLIILIVLLTKRPEESEELGETNYY